MYINIKHSIGYAGVAFFLASSLLVSAQVSPSCLRIQNDLQVGSRDIAPANEVTLLQEFLIGRGLLSVSATGYFGPQTEQAVKSYQASKGITQVGRVGPLTKNAITQDTCGVAAASENENTPVSNVSTTNSSVATAPTATVTLVGGTEDGCKIISGKSSCPLEVSWESKGLLNKTGLASCELNAGGSCLSTTEWYAGNSGTQIFYLRAGVERLLAVWGYNANGALSKVREKIVSGYCSTGLILDGDRCVTPPYVVGSATNTGTSTQPGIVTPPVQTGNGVYKLFVNGALVGTKTNISRSAALSNCNNNIQAGKNVPLTNYSPVDNSIVVCMWNDEQINASAGVGIKWRDQAPFFITVSDLSSTMVNNFITWYAGTESLSHARFITLCKRIASVAPSATTTCSWNGSVVWVSSPTTQTPRPAMSNTSNNTFGLTVDGFAQLFTNETYSTVLTLTPDAALETCLRVALPDVYGRAKSVRCTWNGTEFFNQASAMVDESNSFSCTTSAGVSPTNGVSCQGSAGSVANVPTGTYVRLLGGNSQSPFSGVYTNVTRSTALVDCALNRINTVFDLSIKCTWNGETLLDLPAPPYSPFDGDFTIGGSSSAQSQQTQAPSSSAQISSQTSSTSVCQDVRGTFMNGSQKIEWSCGCLSAPTGTGWNAVESGCFHRVVQ